MIGKKIVISSVGCSAAEVEKSNKIKYCQISPLHSLRKLGLTLVEMTDFKQIDRRADA